MSESTFASSSQDTANLLVSLPEESCLWNIAQYLVAPDVLNYVKLHPQFWKRLGRSKRFWQSLETAQYGKPPPPNAGGNATSAMEEDVDDDDDDENTTTDVDHQAMEEEDAAASASSSWKAAQESYLLRAHCHLLPRVRWHHVASNTTFDNGDVVVPTAREGHLSCRMGNLLVVTGGFSDDDHIYIKEIYDDDNNNQHQHPNTNDAWQRILPGGVGLPPGQVGWLPPWAYGASLTAIDGQRAVRFGGFQSGGYTSEMYDVAILHITRNSLNPDEWQAHWQTVICKLPNGVMIPDGDPGWLQLAARAYHSVQFLFDRYLLVVGGMQANESILAPLLLDTATWTWHYDGVTAVAGNDPQAFPHPRHGASLINDIDQRGRMVLFGGADGSDLLRSGHDYCDVWELNLNGCSSADDIVATFPWIWHPIHTDQKNPSPSISREEEEAKNSMEQDDGGDDNDDMNGKNPNRLTPAEKLNLGRCHGAFRVSPQTVLFAFGSGRPTCNSLLGYRLDREEFFRIQDVRGRLPRSRFTFASILIEELGYLVIHGGFSTHPDATTLSDTLVLDLAAGRGRNFRMWPVDADVHSYPLVTDEEALSAQAPRAILDHLIEALVETPPAARPGRAATMLAYLQATQRLGGRPAMLLHLVATGGATLGPDGSIVPVGARVEGEPNAQSLEEEDDI